MLIQNKSELFNAVLFGNKGEGDRKKKMEELEEYQRKFRNLESDRKAYAEETVALIKKQRGIVDKLKNENQQLKDIIVHNFKTQKIYKNYKISIMINQ